MSKQYEIDMTEGALLPKIILFSLPLMLSGMLQLVFNAADIIVVGRYVGSEAMAAVGSTAALINMIIQVFMGLSVGVNVCVAQAYGARKDRELREIINTSVTTALVAGVLLIFVGIALTRPMLEWMGSPEDVIGQSTLYMRIYFAGMPVIMLYNFVSAILRAVGDTKRPLYYLIHAGIINVILNLVFVVYFRIGVAGVALATALSQVYSAVAVLLCLIRDRDRLQLDWRHLSIDKRRLWQIFKIGFPAGLQGTIFSLSNVVIQSSINSFGSLAMAGSTASSNIEGFVYNAMNSLYQANLSFTSQNLGARRYSRINRILFSCQGVVIAVGLLLGMGVVLLRDTLISFYTNSPQVLAYASERLKIICYTYFFCGMMDVMVGSMRGLGYSVLPMIVSLTGACGFRILWIMTLFQLPQFHSLPFLFYSYPLSWALTFAVHLICFMIIRKKFPDREEVHYV